MKHILLIISVFTFSNVFGCRCVPQSLNSEIEITENIFLAKVIEKSHEVYELL